MNLGEGKIYFNGAPAGEVKQFYFGEPVEKPVSFLVRSPKVLRFQGQLLEYNLETLLKVGLIGLQVYRRWRAIELQRKGRKVFWPRRTRSIKGK